MNEGAPPPAADASRQRRRRIWRWIIILLCAALAAAVAAAYRRDIVAAHQRVNSGSKLIQTPCGPIEYATRGTGPPVLVVHGAGGGFDQGMDIADPLITAGYRVIAVSRFGYLRTPMPAEASAEAQADAHACLLTALGVQRAAVIGASAGAPSSLQFALRHPERCAALVLLVPAVFTPRPEGAAPVHTPRGTSLMFDTALRSDFVFWAAQHVAPALLGRAILATPAAVLASADAAERARVARIQLHILPVSRRRAGLLNDSAIIAAIPRYDLERILAPTLTLSVEDDLFGTYEAARYTAAHIPDADFAGFATGGHVWVGHHAEVLARIVGFLSSHPDR